MQTAMYNQNSFLVESSKIFDEYMKKTKNFLYKHHYVLGYF